MKHSEWIEMKTLLLMRRVMPHLYDEKKELKFLLLKRKALNPKDCPDFHI